MTSNDKINDFKMMIHEEVSKLQQNGSFVNPKPCKKQTIQFHLLTMFILYTQDMSCTSNSDNDSDSSSQIENDDFKIVSNFKTVKNMTSNILTQAATFIYEAKIDFTEAKLSKQNSNLNSKTAFNLQQTAEKLMKGLIIMNNSSLLYKTNLAYSHNLCVLAKNVGYDFKSLCFSIANNLEALGKSSTYKQLLAVRARYPNTGPDTIDCTTLPYLAFKNCDFVHLFDLIQKLFNKTLYYLAISSKSKILDIGKNNLIYKFDSLHNIELQSKNENKYF
jgi:HEPN domain-containing protein